jgi:hypothetical protein
MRGQDRQRGGKETGINYANYERESYLFYASKPFMQPRTKNPAISREKEFQRNEKE